MVYCLIQYQILITRIGRDVCKPVKRTVVKISGVKERSTMEIICPQIIIAIIAGINELKASFYAILPHCFSVNS